MANHLLEILILLPLLGALVTLFLPKGQQTHLQWVAFVMALLEFMVSLGLFFYFDESSHLLQLVNKREWIPTFGISFFVGIDGISFWLVLLTTFLTPLVILANPVETKPKAYFISLFILETAMIGTFISLDLFLFYVFWELMLIPMYFIIGIWGGARRLYATMKFFIYTFLGGVLMLVGIIFLMYLHYEQFGSFSANLLDIYAVTLPFGSNFLNIESILFLTFAFAFLIKIPMFPFHTWLPDAHVEAPTGGSVILAGVLLKMGGYGFLRFAIPLFPHALHMYLPLLLLLSIIGIIYGACLALAQTDLKKLVAYSSISHMGLVMMGILALNEHGLTGGLFQMLSHGLSTGALFLMVGMLYERRHSRDIFQFGGLSTVIPKYAVILLLVSLSSIALPTTNGFIGEFLVLLGIFERNPWLALLGGTTAILGAYYMLSMYQKVAFGPVVHEENKTLQDLSLREYIILIPILSLIFWMGLYPHTFIKKMERSVDYLISHTENYTLEIYEQHHE